MYKHTHDCLCGKNRRFCYKECSPLDLDKRYLDPRCCGKEMAAYFSGPNFVAEIRQAASGFRDNTIARGAISLQK